MQPLQLLKLFILLPRSASICKELCTFKPELVHTFWGHYPCLPAIMYYLFDSKKCRYTQFLGAYDLELKLKISLYYANAIAKKIWTHAEVNLDTLRKFGVQPSKLRVNYRGIQTSGQPAKKIIDENEVKILSAGRLIPEKGFLDLIQNLYPLFNKESKTNYTLTIAGDGPQKAAIEKFIYTKGLEDRVRMSGHIPQTELFKLMQDSKYFVLTSFSKSERLPNVIKEAIWRGCIPVTNYTQGIYELLPGEFSNLVMEPKKIISFIQNNEAIDIGKLQNHIQSNFSAEQNAKKLIQDI